MPVRTESLDRCIDSRFLSVCEKFPGVQGVYRPRRAERGLALASPPQTSYFTTLYPARQCLYQRFARAVASAGA